MHKISFKETDKLSGLITKKQVWDYGRFKKQTATSRETGFPSSWPFCGILLNISQAVAPQIAICLYSIKSTILWIS